MHYVMVISGLLFFSIIESFTKKYYEFQAPSHLKELVISQTSLKEIPDLLGISDSLENVFLDAENWPIQGLSLIESLSMDLSSICLSFSRLKGEQVSVKRGRTFCKSLVIKNFKFNGKVDWNNGGISASVKAPASGLEKLEISDEKFLSKICICGIHYPRLKSIGLCGIDNLIEVNLTSVKTLNCLVITRCLKIQRIIIDRLSCVENMAVDTCEKLQSIMLPTTLCSLSIRKCRNLQRVSGNGDFMELKELTICDCPELEELTSLSGASCVENMEVGFCAKLENIAAGIEELQVSKSLTLNYCSNAIIRNCIDKLKNPPSCGMFMIGKAVDAAESILNEYLFSEAHIGADSLTDVTRYYVLFGNRLTENAVIDCYLVVSEGKWMITRVDCPPNLYQYEDFKYIEYGLRSRGLIKKGFRVELKKWEEWKIVGVLRTIVDRLYS